MKHIPNDDDTALQAALIRNTRIKAWRGWRISRAQFWRGYVIALIAIAVMLIVRCGGT